MAFPAYPANLFARKGFIVKFYVYLCSIFALVAKLVDAPDLGSGVARRVGSSPIRRTMRQKSRFDSALFFVHPT